MDIMRETAKGRERDRIADAILDVLQWEPAASENDFIWIIAIHNYANWFGLAAVLCVDARFVAVKKD